MATVEHEIKGKCAICNDKYKDPKILPCVHSFCKICLLTSLRTIRHSDPLICPVCGNAHYLSKSTIKALPANFFLENMPDTPFALNDELLGGEDSLYASIPSKTDQSDQGADDAMSAPLVDDSTTSRVVPVPAKRGITKSHVEKIKGMCTRHPNGSIYCKTCNVYQCLMCRNNREHRTHDVEEVKGTINSTPGTRLYTRKKSDSPINTNFVEQLQLNHISGHTEELCKIAMDSIRSEATTLEIQIKKCADQSIKQIEEEKLKLLKILTNTEATKLQTIRRALESANQLTYAKSQRIPNPSKPTRRPVSQIISPQDRTLELLPDIPKDSNANPDNKGSSKRRKNIELDSSLRCLGLTFAQRDHEGSFLLGELKEIPRTNSKKGAKGHRNSKRVESTPDMQNKKTVKVKMTTFSEIHETINETELLTSMENSRKMTTNKNGPESVCSNDMPPSSPDKTGSDRRKDDQLPLQPTRDQPPLDQQSQPVPAHRPLRRLQHPNPHNRPLPTARVGIPLPTARVGISENTVSDTNAHD